MIEHLQMFPKTIFKDDLEWEIASLEGNPWEYEGSPECAIEEAHFFEEFQKQHPSSTFFDDAQLNIAKAYRVAYHCFEGKPIQILGKKFFNEKDALKCKERAILIFQGLLQSRNEFIREKARLAIFNIKKGQKSYNYKNDIEADF
jgi:hypothetical protein